MTPLTDNQKKLIVNNIISACKDINKLNATGYKFLNLGQGFIAHYNLHGFKDYYSDHSLAREILQNAESNMWRNFRPGEENYEYYAAKAQVYRTICNKLDPRPNA